jgi:hypothetical protein
MTTKSDFLPADYEAPKSDGKFAKLKEGNNKFRILSTPLIGWEYWTTDRKPVRSATMWNHIPADADISGKNGWDPKHFWCFVVWNLDIGKLQILEITQKGIREILQSLIENEDWGDPREYSINIKRVGKDLLTKYTVEPSPHKKTPAAVLKAFEEANIDLATEMEMDIKRPVEEAAVDEADLPF